MDDGGGGVESSGWVGWVDRLFSHFLEVEVLFFPMLANRYKRIVTEG